MIMDFFIAGFLLWLFIGLISHEAGRLLLGAIGGIAFLIFVGFFLVAIKP